MSGIAGIYDLDGGAPEVNAVPRMLAAMAHRGPDGSGVWARPPVSLAHCRLNTGEEASARPQPLVDETAGLAIVLDGRIANGDEIRRSLARDLPDIHSGSDAELIMRSYELWGQDCAALLIGEFAFAIWDERQRELLCVRDAFGLKPFYYCFQQNRFLFASELQPLFAAGVEREPNLLLTGEYLCRAFDEREETLYQNVFRLPAAHSLTLRAGRLIKRKYWHADPSVEVRYRTDAEYADHFRTLFRDAVARSFNASRAACWLSGGLDSSSIACTAQVLHDEGTLPQQVETYSVVFDEQFGCDERQYMGEVARMPGVRAHYLPYVPGCERVQLERARDFPDTFYDPMAATMGAGLEQMRAQGIKVALDGVGGDELFHAGFAPYCDYVHAGSIRSLLRQAKHDGAAGAVSPLALLWQHALRPLVPKVVKRVARQVLPARIANQLIRPELLRSLQERLRRERIIPDFSTESQKAVYANLYYGWNATVAADQDELFTSRFSVERRRPFFYRPLVEYVLAVPQIQRLRPPWTKFLLRNAMRGILPETIRLRQSKAEFSPPLELELRASQRGKVAGLMRESRLVEFGVVDRTQLRVTCERYNNGTDPGVAGTFELLVGLELWYRGLETPVLV